VPRHSNVAHDNAQLTFAIDGFERLCRRAYGYDLSAALLQHSSRERPGVQLVVDDENA
jgi:hypothetical protein